MRVEDLVSLLVFLTVAVLLAFPVLRMRIPHWRPVGLLLLLVPLAAQLLFRRFFWQLLPADLAALLTAVACLRIRQKNLLLLTAAVSVCLLTISTASLCVLPLFRLPTPTGSYAVGTRILCLTDTTRLDPAFTGGHRQLMVQVWYPTDSTTQPLANYRRWKETTLLSSYDAFLKTHSHLDAPIARRGTRYPVLLFNHAWGGSRTQNTYQMEELASHGYVVIAIDHTHNSALVSFPGGEIIASAHVQPIDDFTHSTFEKQMDIAERELDTQVKDDIFVLNTFAASQNDPTSPWYQALDMSHIGTLGHSFGGAVSVETAFRDPRVRAALNMDGWMYGQIATTALNKPFFVMYENGWPPDTKQVAKESASSDPGDHTDIWDLHNLQRTLSRYGGYTLTVQGTRHMNFSDRSLYSPIRQFTDSGSMNPTLAHSIVNQYTLAFFDDALNQHTNTLLDPSQQPWPQATLTKWPGPNTAPVR